MSSPLTILSFGGGVQSSALLALVLQGKISQPDCVVFSDTGSEMPHTYSLIAEVIKPKCAESGLEFVTVSSERGRLHEAYSARQALPVVGIRTCTSEFKRTPVHHFIKERLAVDSSTRLPPNSAVQWLGISLDEKRRARSPLRWLVAEFPLIQLGLTRRDCEAINADFWGVEILKSSCWLCPYQSLNDWKSLRLNEPDLFQIAKQMEKATLNRKGRGFFNKPSQTLDGLDFNKTLDDYTPDCGGGTGCFT